MVQIAKNDTFQLTPSWKAVTPGQSHVSMVHADKLRGGEGGAAQGALRLLIAPLRDALPAEQVPARRGGRDHTHRQAQRTLAPRADLSTGRGLC